MKIALFYGQTVGDCAAGVWGLCILLLIKQRKKTCVNCLLKNSKLLLADVQSLLNF